MEKATSTGTNQTNIRAASSQDEEDGRSTRPTTKNSEGRCRTNGKLKKVKFDEACNHCAMTGHRSRECWSERSKTKAKANRRAKKDTSRVSMGIKVDRTHHNNSGHKVGKFVHVHGSQNCSYQPKSVYQSPDEENILMTTSWTGSAANFGGTGNFGGLNLYCLNTNKFRALAEETADEIPRVEQI